MTQATDRNYWISPTALSFALNALDNPDYMQVTVSSGSALLCFMPGIEGLGYDEGHNYRRWLLTADSVAFGNNDKKYVYVRIPRTPASIANDPICQEQGITPPQDQIHADLCYPPEEIDIYGCVEEEDGTTTQLGSRAYYYIFLGGIISEVITPSGAALGTREWLSNIVTGFLASDEALSASESPWYIYNAVDDFVTFTKNIVMKAGTYFTTLYAKTMKIVSGGSLSFGDTTPLTGVAKKDTPYDSAAHIATPAYGNEAYLSKLHDDKTVFGLEMNTLAVGNTASLNGPVIASDVMKSLNFLSGMIAGKGWQIDAKGNAELESLKIRSALEVLELVKNKVSAQSGDFVFTEAIHADAVSYNETTGIYTITAQESDESFIFSTDDILRAVISTDNVFRTSWMLVLNDYEDADGRYLVDCIMFADDDTPANHNYPPEAGMVMHRWGNTTDPNRQSTWYISSPEKRIVMLDGVNKPIIEESNYAAFFGLPFDLTSFKGHSLKQTQPYVYARGAFLQDLHIIDYEGNVIKSERFRGTWQRGVTYTVTETTFDTVYHNNIKWRCLKTTTLEPTEGPSWQKLEEALKGDPGNTKPLVGPVSWNDTTTYLSGNGDEPYQNLVFNPEYQAQMFLCKVTNVGVPPSADTSRVSNWDAEHPWYMTNMQEFVATKVFFSQQAYIENLALNYAKAYMHNPETGEMMLDKPTIEIDGETGALTARIFRHGVQLVHAYDFGSESGDYNTGVFWPVQFDGSDCVLLIGPNWNYFTDYILRLPLPSTCVGWELAIVNSCQYDTTNGLPMTLLAGNGDSEDPEQSFCYRGTSGMYYHDRLHIPPYTTCTLVAQKEETPQGNTLYYWYLVSMTSNT